MHTPKNEQHPVISSIADFDPQSGSLAERLLFNNRLWVAALCLLVSLVLGWQSADLKLNASFEKMIPTSHPYVANYLENKNDLKGLGNAVRIAVKNENGSIFDAEYMDVLRRINDEVFLLPGVDRPYMKSLWTPTTRWTAVTEEGLDGDTVVPDGFDGSPQSLDQLRANVERSGEIGRLIAQDFRSSIIFIPLLDINPQTGEPLNYSAFGDQIEQLRAKYQNDNIRIHVTGFAKIVADLIDSLEKVLMFFAVAAVISTVVLFAYTRCLRSTLLVMACSMVAVSWQMGIVVILGYELDPYSILVPFLIFAIGMSHGAQKMNGIMQDIGRGTHRVVAARYTFRRLFVAGMTALLCDAVGFAVLLIIDIEVIQDLALISSIGVAVLIFTNLILLPILLSYVGVSEHAAQRCLKLEQASETEQKKGLFLFLEQFTSRRWAPATVAVGLVLAVGGFAVSQHLKIGDLDPGAPELRPDSRYNTDNAFMVSNYMASSDVFVVMVRTPPDRCTEYTTLSKVDQLAWELEQLPGVDSTNSMAALSKLFTVGYNEGNFKWFELIANRGALGSVQTRAPREMFNQQCSLLTLYVYLKDHKADTLSRVVKHVERFAAQNNDDNVQFLLAAGSAGIEAATNIVVKDATNTMLLWVYGAVTLLCWVTFRSWRAVVVAILPLALTSILCEALMVSLGIGVKVATLPVIALGVGIGVDYALYVLTVMLNSLRQGDTLAHSYHVAMRFTGRVVMLTGFTLAIAVLTWVWSPIKFQADMGILLAFMFLWNMIGSLVLLPSLAFFLLKPANVEKTI